MQDVQGWTVDYGDGPTPITVPHAWRQDVDVRWEGPAIYRTNVSVGGGRVLRFHGVSYACDIYLNGELALHHEGIWDAFDVPLPKGEVDVEVRVIKNGGPTYPVRDCLSGFLPFVYHTFGGIFRPVEVTWENTPFIKWVQPSRYTTDGTRIFCNGEPLYVRGILTWGWYSELGHCHPALEFIQGEIDMIQELGFNTVKFCLWLPPHEYLEELERRGMHAWLELPLWDPAPELYEAKEAELERIILQYAHHPNVLAWTLGCELNNSAPEWRKKWVERLQVMTGYPLVKDNSGGAEMYGGPPAEFGTFDDFHPYGEAHLFPAILDTLQHGPRPAKPILLGETNDHDHHRDIPRIKREMPYWASADPVLNDPGVRWQHDLPTFIQQTPYADARDLELERASHEKGLWIRKYVCEAVRARADYSGYVLTGLIDTPISTSGILTDWWEPRFTPDEFRSWNSDDTLFLIPRRDPKWYRGSNRPGFKDVHNYWEGEPVFIQIGLSQLRDPRTIAHWSLGPLSGTFEVAHAGGSALIGVVEASLPAGSYDLIVQAGEARNSWKITVFAKPDLSGAHLLWPDDRYAGVKFGEGVGIAVGWREELRTRIEYGEKLVVLVDGEGGLPMPYWRECITSPCRPFEHALAFAPDQCLDPAWLTQFGTPTILEARIDTRTYVETPYVARINNSIFTTYRPHGGLGIQPHFAASSPAGLSLLAEFAGFA